ncbi:MAG: hypothetical protein HUU13_04130 [Burkholderiaceae bacterium]|nr:hypothetical protein [Burkholderiaceae bacterium]
MGGIVALHDLGQHFIQRLAGQSVQAVGGRASIQAQACLGLVEQARPQRSQQSGHQIIGGRTGRAKAAKRRGIQPEGLTQTHPQQQAQIIVRHGRLLPIDHALLQRSHGRRHDGCVTLLLPTVASGCPPFPQGIDALRQALLQGSIFKQRQASGQQMARRRPQSGHQIPRLKDRDLLMSRWGRKLVMHTVCRRFSALPYGPVRNRCL